MDQKSKKKAKKPNTLNGLAERFGQLINNPDRYLKPQPEQVDDIYQYMQLSYKASVSNDVDSKKDCLPELVLEDMDEEQIWQQIELRNDSIMDQLLKQTAQLSAMNIEQFRIELDEEEEEEEEKDLNGQDSADETSEDDQKSSAKDSIKKLSQKTKPQQVKATKWKSSVVDDTFFKLHEMRQFLEQEDAKEMQKTKKKNNVDETEDINYFAEDFGIGDESSDEEEGVIANYADFFDMTDELQAEARKLQNGKERDFFNESESEQDDNDMEANEEEPTTQDTDQQGEAASEIDEDDFVTQSGVQPASDSESGSDDEEQEREPEPSAATQSSNEMREARLFQRIRDYEEVVLGEKPWQLKGEIQAGNRPQNSLLEEILEFDSATRPSAPVTEEQNQTIEDIIKQRIRDKAWDDVERTVRPVQTPQEYRKQLVLDQEKSKQSLAQIYEQQYQRELDKLNPNQDAEDSTAPEPKEHQDIKRAMRSLFLKLDALSNFHFTPKPVAPEAKIVTNTPAIHMEEVAPVAVSNAKLLAPEEVFRGPKHMPMGKSERTRTDKNRERRKKKQKQRAINAAIEVRDEQRAKQGKAPTQREANAKLLKTITKGRNVQKITNSDNQGALKSSKAFFNKLQDTTTSAVTAGNKRPKKDPSKANAKKLKL